MLNEDDIDTKHKSEVIQESSFHRMHEVPSPLLKVEYTPLSLPVLTSCWSGFAPAPRRCSANLWWPLKLAAVSAV